MIHPVNIALTAIGFLALTACGVEEAPAADAVADAAKPAQQSQRITINGFECGDNCYLDYRPLAEPDSEPQSALCSVGPCADWFEEQAMPEEFAGRSATVTIGIGQQYDNEGNVMSDGFPLITSLTLDPLQ